MPETHRVRHHPDPRRPPRTQRARTPDRRRARRRLHHGDVPGHGAEPTTRSGSSTPSSSSTSRPTAPTSDRPRCTSTAPPTRLLVLAINPADGPVSPIGLCERAKRPAPQLYLHPPNVGHQFTATDQEMTTVAWLCGRAVVGGDLNPETGDAPDLLREQWLQACVLTLAHLRGEEHAGHAG
ncbi:hypothetical protein G5V59_26870 [Nocardioides sp. W3-2-3]|uniref:hypothetical protein n=1 Tax=Nocardioides convexus TaxID=2712224 RepID=UPI0024185F4B|nr:hypothetical protein [Nocardioides convexus]NHA02016.1 hypothetical protein [Nocardioides convexus]